MNKKTQKYPHITNSRLFDIIGDMLLFREYEQYDCLGWCYKFKHGTELDLYLYNGWLTNGYGDDREVTEMWNRVHGLYDDAMDTKLHRALA